MPQETHTWTETFKTAQEAEAHKAKLLGQTIPTGTVTYVQMSYPPKGSFEYGFTVVVDVSNPIPRVDVY